ncbi:MAG: NfeD family protein [Phycisphaerae bacterium]
MEPYLIWSLVLFAVGLLFVAIEVMIPSGGLLGIVALLCLGGSLASAWQVSGTTAAVMAGIEVICVPVVVAMAFKILPKTRFGQGLILSPPGAPESQSAATSTRPLPNPGLYDDLLGKTGIVVTELRPSGTAEIEGRRISVVSEGETIKVDERIKVALVEGNRVVVESIDA